MKKDIIKAEAWWLVVGETTRVVPAGVVKV
jgi:hypothetical protein